MFVKRLLILLALLVAIIGVLYFTLLRNNFREVIAGEMYGSAQLAGPALKRFVEDKGIRTVISLRQAAPDEAWYREEMAAVTDLGLAHHSIGMYSSSLHVDRIIELHDLVRSAERPLLVHCRAGIDRTGLASILGLLSDKRYTLEDARMQSHRGLDRLRTDTIGRNFLSQYGAWLAAQGLYHSPEVLDDWLRNDYTDPTGNIHFLVHPINGKAWYKPLGGHAEGERFGISRVDSTDLSLDGWAFDAKTGALLAGVEVFIDDQPVREVDYGIHSPWLLEDFGNPAILDAGWRARHHQSELPVPGPFSFSALSRSLIISNSLVRISSR